MKDSIGILRFATAGSVDDGKSTLIGRLLYDSKGIFSDQLEALENDSKLKNQKNIDLAHLTDGLKDEREQGITIDVAYRYFSTTKRKFIIADTPGHEEYTRNMFTGASNSNLAIILIDSRKGEVYMALYDFNIKTLIAPHSHVISKNSLVEFLNNHKISFFGTGVEKLKGVVSHDNAYFTNNVFPSSKHLIELAHLKYNQKDFADISNFEPLYLKEFIPTQQKKNII